MSTDYTAVEWYDEGACFRDVNGKEFIDMLGGFGIYIAGHRHPKVLKAVFDQLNKQGIHSQELIDPLRTYLAHLVALITPGDLQYAFLTNSGTESVEGCLRCLCSPPVATNSSAASAASTVRALVRSPAHRKPSFASHFCR